jgi:hypothetical protein
VILTPASTAAGGNFPHGQVIDPVLGHCQDFWGIPVEQRSGGNSRPRLSGGPATSGRYASPQTLVCNSYLNKNPSSSNKTRTPHNSTCTGSPSTPPNSSDRIFPDALRVSRPTIDYRLFHPPQFLPARSSPSAQHTPTQTRTQVETNLPRKVLPLCDPLPPVLKILYLHLQKSPPNETSSPERLFRHSTRKPIPPQSTQSSLPDAANQSAHTLHQCSRRSNRRCKPSPPARDLPAQTNIRCTETAAALPPQSSAP